MTASGLLPDGPPPQVGEGDLETMLSRAIARHQARDRDQADALYRQILQTHPEAASAFYQYAVFQLEAGHTDEAERLIERFVALRPGDPQGHLSLAEIAEHTGRRDVAIQRYRDALAVAPGHTRAVSQLASLVLESGFADAADFEGAIDVCRAAVALLPDPAPAQAMLARFLAAAGRTEAAIDAYRAALALRPDEAATWAELSLSLISLDDSAAALEAAGAALALDPRQADALYVQGSALLRLHRATEARAAFERGVEATPDEARMHLGLGDACAELDQEREALEHLRRAVALEPGSKWAQANFGAMLYRWGQLDAAERHCRWALEIDPDLVPAHRNLAGILEDRGDLDGARRHRDATYRLCNLVIEPAPGPATRVLTLTTVGSGNIPHKYLLPRHRYTRIDWFIEYAEEGQAARLPPYDVVFNIIGDADYADPTDAAVKGFLAVCDRPVLNDPVLIGPTRRDRLPAHLADLQGVATPRAARLDPADADDCDPVSWLAGQSLPLPVLIRPLGSHGGRGLTLVTTNQDLADVDPGGGLYATEFFDFRSPADGLYRKYRAIFVDREVYPYHLAVKDDWLVHYYSAEMSGDDARKAEELRFLEDPQRALGEAAWSAVAAIGRRLDLDYAGVDFSLLPDGRVLVFEANATMLVHPDQGGEFAYKIPFVARITDAFQALVEQRAKAGRQA